MKKNMLYKFLMPGMKSKYGNHKWKIGKWYKVDGWLAACSNGFHASRLVCDAISYVASDVLALVEVRGESVIGFDKECWSEMRVVLAWKFTKADFVAMSVYCAELVIDIFEKSYPNDKRPRLAINAAKAWIKNPNSKTACAASEAASAASEAARAAASAARYAAGDAARAASAASEAASAAACAARAARYAASAARAAASEAASAAASAGIKLKVQKWIVRRLKKAKEIGVRRVA